MELNSKIVFQTEEYKTKFKDSIYALMKRDNISIEELSKNNDYVKTFLTFSASYSDFCEVYVIILNFFKFNRIEDLFNWYDKYRIEHPMLCVKDYKFVNLGFKDINEDIIVKYKMNNYINIELDIKRNFSFNVHQNFIPYLISSLDRILYEYKTYYNIAFQSLSYQNKGFNLRNIKENVNISCSFDYDIITIKFIDRGEEEKFEIDISDVPVLITVLNKIIEDNK